MGVTGSGKSTLAERIAAHTGVEWIRSDDAYWDPGWVKVGRDEFRRRILPSLERDAWVIDSLPTNCRAEVLARADLVVGLDLPAYITGPRLLRRTLRRARTREPVCGGNLESWRQTFASRNSILVWWVRTVRERRASITALEQDLGERFLRLRQPREVEAWVSSLGGQ